MVGARFSSLPFRLLSSKWVRGVQLGGRVGQEKEPTTLSHNNLAHDGFFSELC